MRRREGKEGGRVSKGKRRMKRWRGKGTGCVAHLLLMSCESFANCLQVATKSGILSRSWLTCSSTATNCVCMCKVCGVVVGGEGVGEVRGGRELTMKLTIHVYLHVQIVP